MITTPAKRPFRALALVFLLPFLAIFRAQAGDCSDILRWGIHDISRGTTEEHLAASHLEWLSWQEVQNEEEARDLSLKVGVLLPELPMPVELGLSSNQSRSKQYSKALARYYETHTESSRRFSFEFQRVNSDLVTSWRDCMKEDRYGLRCWVKRTDVPSELLLKLDIRPFDIYTPLKEVRVTSIDVSNTVSPLANVVGKVLSQEALSLLYTLKTGHEHDGATFVVGTNNPRFRNDCRIEALPTASPVHSRVLLSDQPSYCSHGKSHPCPDRTVKVEDAQVAIDYDQGRTFFSFKISANGNFRFVGDDAPGITIALLGSDGSPMSDWKLGARAADVGIDPCGGSLTPRIDISGLFNDSALARAAKIAVHIAGVKDSGGCR